MPAPAKNGASLALAAGPYWATRSAIACSPGAGDGGGAGTRHPTTAAIAPTAINLRFDTLAAQYSLGEAPVQVRAPTCRYGRCACFGRKETNADGSAELVDCGRGADGGGPDGGKCRRLLREALGGGHRPRRVQGAGAADGSFALRRHGRVGRAGGDGARRVRRRRER